MSPPTDAPAGRSSLSVGFLLTDAFTLTAFSTFIDTLRLAADDGDGSRQLRCAWTVLGDRARPAKASCGVEIAAWDRCERPERFDYIVVVGGLLRSGRPLAEEAVAFLKNAARAGVRLVGVCTGSFVLARAGLLQGRRSCVSWYHYQDYLAEFPDQSPIADQLFVVDGDRITCAGGAGVADLAAFLIERHLGRAYAQKALHILQIDQARPPERCQPQPPLVEAVNDPRVRRALLLMEQNLAEPLRVEALALRLGVSARQLERLFHAELGMYPNACYRLLRLRHSDWLLRNTDRTVTSVALECGFADGAHFSRQYRQAFGRSPSSGRPRDLRLGPPPGPSLSDRRRFD
ncbi:GlxA family transcriptional regulator [Marinivivus vitaminiproducens]|uniref:GlxA family transcriptional regulator n=1 Tax=Marinivivus vitaminiproducens TaxID=3035935 RepID=UPI0027A5B8D4|nr:GlxA family transcriptional regulator [Geminicoccaceae bacterium SCSIO 64248]